MGTLFLSGELRGRTHLCGRPDVRSKQDLSEAIEALGCAPLGAHGWEHSWMKLCSGPENYGADPEPWRRLRHWLGAGHRSLSRGNWKWPGRRRRPLHHRWRPHLQTENGPPQNHEMIYSGRGGCGFLAGVTIRGWDSVRVGSGNRAGSGSLFSR